MNNSGNEIEDDIDKNDIIDNNYVENSQKSDNDMFT